ncbi:Uncharacterised protein [Candidatus Norongarragalina meridionalis]|nr:Uncharacterised protein [Candidatus Norongarragalina meridionalis]
MVLPCEARCPKCFTQTDVAYEMTHNPSEGTFKCVNCSRVYKEDANGFLRSIQ